MNPFANIPDADIDRLLNGQAPEDSRLEGVAQFVAEIGSVYAEESTAALQASHIAAMLDEAHFAAANSDLAPASAASHGRRDSGLAMGILAAHKWATAAMVACVALLAFGGAAYAGVLPEPVQDATSSLVQQVGIHIPKTHVLKSAVNNGVRDHGAGVGSGKGQGGIHRSIDNSGQASVSTTGTLNTTKPKTTGAAVAAAAAKAAKAANTSGAKRSIKAPAKPTVKKLKRVPAKKEAKRVPKVSASKSDTKKPSFVESDHGKSK